MISEGSGVEVAGRLVGEQDRGIRSRARARAHALLFARRAPQAGDAPMWSPTRFNIANDVPRTSRGDCDHFESTATSLPRTGGISLKSGTPRRRGGAGAESVSPGCARHCGPTRGSVPRSGRSAAKSSFIQRRLPAATRAGQDTSSPFFTSTDTSRQREGPGAVRLRHVEEPRRSPPAARGRAASAVARAGAPASFRSALARRGRSTR